MWFWELFKEDPITGIYLLLILLALIVYAKDIWNWIRSLDAKEVIEGIAILLGFIWLVRTFFFWLI